MVDPRVAGAGMAMAVGLMVLLPTFNALNNSYVTDVAPPAWLAKLIDPDDLPEDFQPPDDFEPPEGWEPPPDFEPPPGWEPPPGYDGPIPPGGCPPPVVIHVEDFSDQLEPQWGGIQYEFEVPQYTVAVGANFTFNNWQAGRIFGSLEDPNGMAVEDDEPGDTGGLLVPATVQPTYEMSLIFQTDSEDLNTMPSPGTYTLNIGAEIAIGGTVTGSVDYMVACGGILE